MHLHFYTRVHFCHEDEGVGKEFRVQENFLRSFRLASLNYFGFASVSVCKLDYVCMLDCLPSQDRVFFSFKWVYNENYPPDFRIFFMVIIRLIMGHINSLPAHVQIKWFTKRVKKTNSPILINLLLLMVTNPHIYDTSTKFPVYNFYITQNSDKNIHKY